MDGQKKSYYKFILRFLRLLGIDLATLYYSIKYSPRFVKDLLSYKSMAKADSKTQKMRLNPRYDLHKDAGVTSGIYFHQDLWAAKKIYQAEPDFHVDIGSRIDGFVAHLLTFTEVKYIDIRPLQSSLPNLQFIQSDATKLEIFEEDSIKSLSSLNVAEHFGLGRYGDPIDPEGSEKFMKSLQRVLAYNGRLYFSVPIGKERVEFNSHRIFNPMDIIRYFDELKLVSYSAIIDGELVESIHPDDVKLKSKSYDCGLYVFTK